MSRFDILIKNGTVVNSQGQSLADVAITGNKVVLVQENISDGAVRTIDATGLHVLPGIIDSQVHFREPGLEHKEDLQTGSKAAVLGGVTTFLEMPNTNPPTTSIDSIKDKIKRATGRCYSNFGFFIGATSENLQELIKAEQVREGLCGIKIFLGSSTGNLLLFDEEILNQIFLSCKLPIALHSESEKILKERMAIRDQAKSVHAHYEWRNAESAIESTKWVVGLAKLNNKKVHVLHITTAEEVEFLEENLDICTFEVTPQHLTLWAPDAYDRMGTYVQMNPPIREKRHYEGLWEGMKRRSPYVIGSDHAPHTREEKDKGYPNTPSGMPGVQTMLPVMLNHVYEGRLSLERLVQMLCENPARLYHLDGKGYLMPQFDADITLVDLKKGQVLRNEAMASRCGWTPFHEMAIHGVVEATIVQGKVVVEHGKCVGAPAGNPIIRRG